MTKQTDFATRIKRINKGAVKADRKRRSKSSVSLGSLLMMPLMTLACASGGVVLYWEVLERPTDTPLGLASDLTARLLSYLG